jgi:HPt (histidine-containing phosphotransfer) domain-containing protein
MTQISKATEPLYSSLSRDPALAEIVGMFVEEMRDRVAALLDQLEAGQWEGLARTAHQLKGAAGSYGFAPISRCAAQLEAAIREGEPEARIRDAVDALIAICKRARGGTAT